MKGLFISFEGIEGSGKSTQARLLYEYLRQRGADVLLTAEPGGTPIGMKIREVLLSPEHAAMDPVAELLLYNASRRQLVTEVIRPAIEAGRTVISDRFSDSTFAYQGFGRGLPLEVITELDRIATDGLRPLVTILIDLPAETGLARNRQAGKTDRFELEDVEFHRRVREGYLKLAARDPRRFRLVRADERTPEEIHAEVKRLLEPLMI